MRVLTSAAGRVRWLLAEVIIIVVGVLIALGLDAWYGTVLEARAEQAYLVQLHQDLRETEQQIQASLEQTGLAEASVSRLLAHLRADQAPDPDSVRAWLAEAQTVNNPVPVLGTAEALISTGDLRLIDSSEARAGVTRWLSRSRDFWLVPLYQLEERHATTLARLLHTADLMGLEPNNRGRQHIRPHDRRPGRPPFQPDAARFAVDPEVHSLVADLVELKAAMVSYRQAMGREATELRLVIEPLLDRP